MDKYEFILVALAMVLFFSLCVSTCGDPDLIDGLTHQLMKE
jgi:hypothetical protein